MCQPVGDVEELIHFIRLPLISDDDLQVLLHEYYRHHTMTCTLQCHPEIAERCRKSVATRWPRRAACCSRCWLPRSVLAAALLVRPPCHRQ